MVPGISSRVSETLVSAPGPACENKLKKTPKSYKTGQIALPILSGGWLVYISTLLCNYLLSMSNTRTNVHLSIHCSPNS